MAITLKWPFGMQCQVLNYKKILDPKPIMDVKNITGCLLQRSGSTCLLLKGLYIVILFKGD